jgi:hypothetical protein
VTALAEALLAAQRQAVGSLSKAFVAGKLDGGNFLEELDRIGLRDTLDQGLLLSALEVLQEHGGEAPKQPNGAKSDPATEPASEAQLKYLRDLADKKGTTAPDGQLTKARASEAIEQLKAGTYNADEWTAPF